ncbi:hypothetical protein ACKWTF_007714 [Chironomus riparius]
MQVSSFCSFCCNFRGMIPFSLHKRAYSISLDPEEDYTDSTVFDGLRIFIEQDMDETERDKFLNKTLKCICRFAKNLKLYRPPRGMNFSLQQNADSVEFDVKFIACLMANSFFSTYPKRTNKTHPTLKDFNFTHFFKELNTNSQKAKFRSFLWYFEWLEQQPPEELDRKVKLSRKVMSGRHWLTIEDWLECKLPLCPVDIKHDSRLENSPTTVAQVIFSQPAIASSVLIKGANQESTQTITHPELLIILLFVEKLEDNEIFLIESVMQVSRIIDPKGKAMLEKLQPAKLKSSMICMDAESYKSFPISQFEEDNTLRELNKCLLAFRQNTCAPMSSKLLKILSNHSLSSRDQRGRLSPIGESFNTSGRSSLDCATKIYIEQNSPTSSPATFSSRTESRTEDDDEIGKRRNWLNLPENKGRIQNSTELSSEEKRRGRFIVLGSSGECLPVNRQISKDKAASFFANGSDGEDTDEDETFYSARNSLNAEDDDEDEFFDHQRYSIELETPENRFRFAKQLKDALKLENGYTESTEDCSIDEDEFDDSYAVDINIEGSRMNDEKIKIRRGTSTGFILEEDSSLDDYQMLARMDTRKGKMKRNKTGDSSKYSFDTEESEVEEIYDQLSKWLNDPLDSRDRKLDSRDKAVLKFADSLLKRALSESFVDDTTLDDLTTDSEEFGNLSVQQKRKMVKNFRSLSLEVAKYKNQLSSSLKPLHEHDDSPEDFKKFVKQKVTERDILKKQQKEKSNKWSITTTTMEESINCDVTIKLNQRKFHHNSNLRTVATGSWGCGESHMGDPQYKAIIQWLSASVANVPILIYYTCSNENLSKLDTVVRVLQDRKWTVGELLRHTLFYARDILNNPTANHSKNFCLFDKLIGLERSN